MDRTTAPYSAAGAFVDANPGGGVPRGTTITAPDLNAYQEDIIAAIEAAGLVPDPGDLTQIAAGRSFQRGDSNVARLPPG